ncbi:MAG: RES domain-containing protein [Syntrophaceae bacterium]|nr:RES domain-containing protein [Pseudomonadota bacterium]MCG2740414.1 RES domain-containing protein [Syntrophaceae bacterium]
MGHIYIKNFQKIKPVSFSGAFFRSVSLKHSGEIIDTEGSFEHGGRYNPMREFGALYMSASKEVCKKEITQKQREAFLGPRIIGQIKVSVTKLLDLTNTGNLKKLGIKKEDLIRDKDKGGWTLTWEMARLAYNTGYEAILSPSVTSKGSNLVVFDKSLSTTKIALLSKTQE